MYYKLSLLVASTALFVSAGIASAGDIEVNTGNTQVSIKGQTISVDTPASRTSPSLLERLRTWRSNRPSVPVRVITTTSRSGKCQTTTSSQQSTQRSGSGVVQSSSSSSSTVCR